ncbi:VOC family protein [Pseudohaliea sp.]|uniref:VOC family protein n=1 Tax=Pseudohaliea sp. TaxID=2740289 RepID=UPI0032EF3D11
MTCRLDHLLIGARSLASCTRWASHALEVTPTPGGYHPGRGTENALLGLGDTRYLEFIAESAAAGGRSRASELLSSIDSPAFCWWAVASQDLERARSGLASLGIPCGEIVAGERETPDGERLRWRLCYPQCEDLGALLPFVIEWQQADAHPGLALTATLQLERLELSTAKPNKLVAALEALELREPALTVSEAPEQTMSVILRAGQRRTTLASPALPPVA